MKMNVVNKEISVGSVEVIGVASSAVLLIGDTESIVCGARFDTPPEGLIVGPLVPLEDV